VIGAIEGLTYNTADTPIVSGTKKLLIILLEFVPGSNKTVSNGRRGICDTDQKTIPVSTNPVVPPVEGVGDLRTSPYSPCEVS
jgi:hypothetical protein